MKKLIITCFILIVPFKSVFSQAIRVAIIDFENISGVPRYDGLGKAMSSMLISDIEANVSPKRLQLIERSQINKILKEQNFQSSSAVDKASAVQIGKILGVKYLLLGDIYVLNDILVINARLTDTETGDIKFSKKQEGNLTQWLMLKTNIAKELSASISMPFSVPDIPDKAINPAVITSFGNALSAKDNGNIEKAEQLITTIQDFSPDFKYIDDLKLQLEELKKQVKQNTDDISILEKSGGRIKNAESYEELRNNLYNSLTGFEEREKILLSIFENYSDKLETDWCLLRFFPDGSGGQTYFKIKK